MPDPTSNDNKVVLEVEFDTSKAAEAARKRAEAEQKADEARWNKMAREDAKAEERQKQRAQKADEAQAKSEARAEAAAKKKAEADAKAEQARLDGEAKAAAKADARDKERQRRQAENQQKADEREAKSLEARINAMIKADVMAEDRFRKRVAAEEEAARKKTAAEKKAADEEKKADAQRWSEMAKQDQLSEINFRRQEAAKALRGGASFTDLKAKYGDDAAMHAVEAAAERKAAAGQSRKEALEAKYGSSVGGAISSLTSGILGTVLGRISGPLLAITAGAKFIGHIAESFNAGTEASSLAGGSSNAAWRAGLKNFFVTAPLVGISDAITGRAFDIRRNARVNEEDMTYAQIRQRGEDDRYGIFRQVVAQLGRAEAAGVAYQGPANASFNRSTAVGERQYQDEMIRQPLRESATAAAKNAAAASQQVALQQRLVDTMLKSEANGKASLENAKKNYDRLKDAGGPKAQQAALDVQLALANLTAVQDRVRAGKDDFNAAKVNAINAQFGVKAAGINTGADLGVLQNRLEQANRGVQTFARANVGDRMQAIQAIQMAKQFGTDMVPPELRAIGEQFAPNTFNKLYEQQVKGDPGLKQLQDIAPADFRPGDTPEGLRKQIDETIDKVRAQQQALDKDREAAILGMVTELDKISREATAKQIATALQQMQAARAAGAQAN